VRIGLAQMIATVSADCTASLSCGTPDHSNRPGFELSGGYDFQFGAGFALGPVVWMAQALGGTVRSRTRGLGVHLVAY